MCFILIYWRKFNYKLYSMCFVIAFCHVMIFVCLNNINWMVKWKEEVNKLSTAGEKWVIYNPNKNMSIKSMKHLGVWWKHRNGCNLPSKPFIRQGQVGCVHTVCSIVVDQRKAWVSRGSHPQPGAVCASSRLQPRPKPVNRTALKGHHNPTL